MLRRKPGEVFAAKNYELYEVAQIEIFRPFHDDVAAAVMEAYG